MAILLLKYIFPPPVGSSTEKERGCGPAVRPYSEGLPGGDFALDSAAGGGEEVAGVTGWVG